MSLRTPKVIIVVRIIAWTIVGIAMSAMIGSVTGHDKISTWGGAVKMAYPTSVCFILAAVDFMLLSTHGDVDRWCR